MPFLDTHAQHGSANSGTPLPRPETGGICLTDKLLTRTRLTVELQGCKLGKCLGISLCVLSPAASSDAVYVSMNDSVFFTGQL